MYEELITHLRECAVSDEDGCYDCCFIDSNKGNGCKICVAYLAEKAADAIEELRGVIQQQREMINASAYLPLYPKPMKWIPVTERLPENDKTVLVWNRRNSREYFDVYDHGSWIILESEDITHWMPLPEPPKEEKDG